MRTGRLRLTCAGIAVALVVLSGASAARAHLVLQQRMGGVSLGMTETRVRALLGKPRSVVVADNDLGTFTELRYPAFTVTFQNSDRATRISTRLSRERTRSGAGVGSRERDLRRLVRGVRCETFSGFRHCLVGRELPGERVTEFSIKHGRVVRIDIALVVD